MKSVWSHADLYGNRIWRRKVKFVSRLHYNILYSYSRNRIHHDSCITNWRVKKNNVIGCVVCWYNWYAIYTIPFDTDPLFEFLSKKQQNTPKMKHIIRFQARFETCANMEESNNRIFFRTFKFIFSELSEKRNELLCIWKCHIDSLLYWSRRKPIIIKSPVYNARMIILIRHAIFKIIYIFPLFVVYTKWIYMVLKHILIFFFFPFDL